MKFKNKVVVITGSGSGIGRALGLALVARGARVAAVDMNPSSLAETVRLAGARQEAIATFLLDITDRAAVSALPAQVIERLGAVDALINNAGIIQPFVRVNELEEGVIDRVMNVNFFGTLSMTRAFLPHLLARPTAHLANISSMGGLAPVPGQTIYGASKAAVKLLTEGLASELEKTNVKVSVIFPGGVTTNITENSGITNMRLDPAKSAEAAAKMLTPEKAARIILDGLERDRARILVGDDARVLDALYRLSPERARRFIAKQMGSLLGD